MPVNLSTPVEPTNLPEQIKEQNASAEEALRQAAGLAEEAPPVSAEETPPAPEVTPAPTNVVPIQQAQESPELAQYKQLVQSQQSQLQQMQNTIAQLQQAQEQANAPKLEDEYRVAFNSPVQLEGEDEDVLGRDSVAVVSKIVEQKVQEAIQPLLVKLAERVNQTQATQYQTTRTTHEQQILSAVPNAEELYSGKNTDFVAWLVAEVIPYSGGKTKRDILLESDQQMQTSTVIQILKEYNDYVAAKAAPQQQQVQQQQNELQQQVVPESAGATNNIAPTPGIYPASRYNNAVTEFTKGNLPLTEMQQIELEFNKAVAANRVDYST